jgi:hypothetical protein
LKCHRKHKQAKVRRQKKKELKIAELTSKRQGYINALETAISSTNFSGVFLGNIHLVSSTQVLKVATQSMALLRYYKSLVKEPFLLKKELYEKLALQWIFLLVPGLCRIGSLILKKTKEEFGKACRVDGSVDGC